MHSRKLKIATCQFAVGDNIAANTDKIIELMQKSKKLGAEIVHFSECALSGYAGADFTSTDELDFYTLTEKTKLIMAEAKKMQLWVVLGSTHRLTEPNLPHNCLYLLNPAGEITTRYDKRFCTENDLKNYTPGNRFAIFEINGIKCALLICFDLRFPELYRQLKKLGTECIFQSFYNARQSAQSVHRHIMIPTMQARAASNGLWISVANSCGKIAPYASCVIQPDGEIVKQLKLNTEGIMLNTVDADKAFYDPSKKFRPAAIDGVLTNGNGCIDDIRSKDTKNL